MIIVAGYNQLNLRVTSFDTVHRSLEAHVWYSIHHEMMRHMRIYILAK